MRRTGLIAAGLALALTLVGCGSKQAGTPVAADGSGGSGNAGEGKLLDALGLAAAVNDNSKAKQSAKMAMNIEAAGQTMKAEGQFRQTNGDTAMQMSMDMGTMKMEMVLVDKVLYIKLPAELAGAVGGKTDKPWVKVSEDGQDPLSKQLSGVLDSVDDSFDVGKQMEQLKTAGTITKQGKESLDGEQVTHYWITLDVAKMVANGNKQVQESAEAAKKMGVKTIDMEMWANSDNLPVKITTSIPVQGQSVKMTATYSDWGKPVTIAAPPADQVGELGPK